MNGLPNGYSVRPGTMADLDRLIGFVNTYFAAVGSGERYTIDQMAGQLSVPGFDIESSLRLVFSSYDALVGAGLVIDIREPHVQVFGAGMVSVDHTGRGIGTALHRWIEARAREAIPRAPAGARVTLVQQVAESAAAANAFLKAVGYEQTRHFWKMAIAFDGPVPTPQWPDGIALRTIDPQRDLEAAAVASNDAFRDHYGFVEGPLEEQIARYRHRIDSDPTYDPTLNFLALDGDQIAAICLCSPRTGDDDSIGYVGTLGVRRAWRRRGLALALLRHAFGELQRRGKRGAALHVDAQSLTGATRLYEKAGMRVEELSHEYQLELRPGTDLAARTAD